MFFFIGQRTFFAAVLSDCRGSFVLELYRPVGTNFLSIQHYPDAQFSLLTY